MPSTACTTPREVSNSTERFCTSSNGASAPARDGLSDKFSTPGLCTWPAFAGVHVLLPAAYTRWGACGHPPFGGTPVPSGDRDGRRCGKGEDPSPLADLAQNFRGVLAEPGRGARGRHGLAADHDLRSF